MRKSENNFRLEIMRFNADREQRMKEEYAQLIAKYVVEALNKKQEEEQINNMKGSNEDV